MSLIYVFYATREGQTRRIAERVGQIAAGKGHEIRVINVAQLGEQLEFRAGDAAVLAASIHAGTHESEMVGFVKKYREQLTRVPTAFISVSLTEAGAEDVQHTPEQRARDSAEVERMIAAFCDSTGWHPTRSAPVAGALPYTQYGVLKRFIMKAIVKHKGGSTDTSRDHEYTDWAALARFVEDFLAAAAELPAAHA